MFILLANQPDTTIGAGQIHAALTGNMGNLFSTFRADAITSGTRSRLVSTATTASLTHAAPALFYAWDGITRLEGDTAYLTGDGIDLVNYWEVDPDWDGVVFRSAGQAVRPLRKGAIPAEIALTAGSWGKTAGRVVDVFGKMIQIGN